MPSPLFIPASAENFRFAGRFDFSDRAGPVIIWAGSRISLDFDGPALAVRFGQAVDQNVFDIIVDGQAEVVAVPPGGRWTYVWPHLLKASRHRFSLFKRTEAAAGHVCFTGVEIVPGAETWAPPVTHYKLRMEFFGDSITAGACNQDGATDQWEDRRTHNHALSYSTLTSAAFNADYRCMAVSGMGISAGYVDVKAGQVWDKIFPRADSPVADLKAWQPDVACLNFGENDDSFTQNQHEPFPAGFTAGYVALVKAIRTAYPHTHLVLLRGGMYGGAKSPALRASWDAAVKELEAGDTAISHFVFTHWSANHPRVSDDRVLAGELTSWLKQQPWLARFL